MPIKKKPAPFTGASYLNLQRVYSSEPKRKPKRSRCHVRIKASYSGNIREIMMQNLSAHDHRRRNLVGDTHAEHMPMLGAALVGRVRVSALVQAQLGKASSAVDHCLTEIVTRAELEPRHPVGDRPAAKNRRLTDVDVQSIKIDFCSKHETAQINSVPCVHAKGDPVAVQRDSGTRHFGICEADLTACVETSPI